MKLLFLILFFILLAIGCKNSKIISETENIDNIQQSIDRHAKLFLNDSTTNSVSIGIYKDGKTYIGHYGELDKGKGNKPTDSTLYDIASVSKTFAGTLVAQAELEGKLSIEDNIQKYLNEDYPNLQFEGKPIKIKHLITHTSGLPKFLPDSVNLLFNKIDDDLPFKYSDIEKKYNRKQFLSDLHTLVITTIPGSQSNYSNVGTELIGHILENIYGKGYEELLKEYICSVADMPNTKINISDNEKNKLANGYFGKSNIPVPHLLNPLWGANGCIKSTTPDLINYMKFHLDKNNPVVTKSHGVFYQEKDYNIGCFWVIETDRKDGTYYLHDGTSLGIENWMFIYPKYDLGISIISNRIDEKTEDKMINVVDGILKDIRKSM